MIWWFAWIALGLAAIYAVVYVSWRGASRKKSVPFPVSMAWMLESPWLQRLSGTNKILDRLGLRPGQRILEVGVGPGRLLIPAAKRIGPAGVAVGIDIQPGMIERVRSVPRKLASTT